MGNCECNNPMDFGNEINADDKEEKSTQNNRINQKKANISDYEKTNLEVVESNEYKQSKFIK